jgi:hypothetical protein
MATFFKSLGVNDRVVSTTPLASAFSLTGSALSKSVTTDFYNSYGLNPSNTTIDGLSISYIASSSTAHPSASNMYKQLCHQLLGYDQEGALKEFKHLTSSLGTELAVLFFPRSSTKDKVKEGTLDFKVVGNVSSYTDYTGSYSACETGFYSYVYNGPYAPASVPSGALFYEAGILVMNSASINAATPSFDLIAATTPSAGAEIITSSLSLISASAVTELNSTIYFCRAFNNEFNYSSNPTYIDSDCQIRVKMDDPMVEPHAYITTVGLYNDKQELLAVGKFSKPIKKSPQTELIARLRLDF